MQIKIWKRLKRSRKKRCKNSRSQGRPVKFLLRQNRRNIDCWSGGAPFETRSSRFFSSHVCDFLMSGSTKTQRTHIERNRQICYLQNARHTRRYEKWDWRLKWKMLSWSLWEIRKRSLSLRQWTCVYFRLIAMRHKVTRHNCRTENKSFFEVTPLVTSAEHIIPIALLRHLPLLSSQNMTTTYLESSFEIHMKTRTYW